MNELLKAANAAKILEQGLPLEQLMLKLSQVNKK